MRFKNIVLEGPDCAGKTTLFNALHKATDYKYNIHDRSALSMLIFSKYYKRDSDKLWYDTVFDELKKFNTLYVVIIPSDKVVKERLNKRGDAIQDEESILEISHLFRKICNSYFKDLPNFLMLNTESETVENISKKIIQRIGQLEQKTMPELIKKFIANTPEGNEVLDIVVQEKVNHETLNYEVLDYPEEKDYYNDIISQITETIKIESDNILSRRFIFSNESCISTVHALFRQNMLNVSIFMRSSNVDKSLPFDYEFLKILCCKIRKLLNLEEKIEIMMTLHLRSAHIVP